MNILSSFLLLPSDKLPLVQVGWTLIHELYFYLVYFFIILFLPEDLLVYAVGGWGVCVVLLNLFASAGNSYIDLVSNPLTVEFLAGCLLAVMYHRSVDSKLEGRTLIVIAGASLLAALIGYDYYRAVTGVIAPSGWWRVLIYGLPALSITGCLIYAERTKFVLHPSLFQIGNASYSIYLSHLFTINVVGRLWAIFSVDQLFDNVIFVLITLSTVLLIGFASYFLVENTLLKLSRKIV